jgi:hypothetical protein
MSMEQAMERRFSALVAAVLLVVAAACGEKPAAATGPIQDKTDTATEQDVPSGNSCSTAIDFQKCDASGQRLQCGSSAVWEVVEVCAIAQKCVEIVGAGGKTKAVCQQATVPDADTDGADAAATGPDQSAEAAPEVVEPDLPPADEEDPCGDGKCTPPENSVTCPLDCQAPASCGNELCEAGEDEGNCAPDCGYASEFMLCLQAKCPAPFKTCNLDQGCAEFSECAIDCGGTVKCIELCLVGLAGNTLSKGKALVGCAYDNKCYPTSCGDGACQGPKENGVSCSKDCKAGAGACGDGTCGGSENHKNCPGDCKEGTTECGNGTCEPGETPASCAKDCSAPLKSGCKDLCGKQSQENGKICFCDDLCIKQDPPDCCSDKATLCPTTCTPKCEKKVCGDDGCGGECEPGCGGEETCKADGSACEQPAAKCGNMVCDPGETTVTCPGDCPCQKKCEGKVCGSDGCGGLCAKCATGSNCNSTGTACVPKTCGNKICDTGETEANCPGDCKASCTPQCTNKKCGPDGCGGECGKCQTGQTCKADQSGCTCIKQCTGKVCGPDGCGGTCGTCPTGKTCKSDGTGCDGGTCTKQCTAKVCGPDGCGGVCGTCTDGKTCKSDGSACEGGTACSKQCTGKVCGWDGCSGTCGTCPAGKACVLDKGTCTTEPFCGNGACGTSETATSCSKDCTPATVGCKNNCAKSSKDAAGKTCWCDSVCSTKGDCCADKGTWCPGL